MTHEQEETSANTLNAREPAGARLECLRERATFDRRCLLLLVVGCCD